MTASGSPHNPTGADPAHRRERMQWLDLFRGAAVLVMIETHVVNTFLAAALRENAWFALLNYVNGLVAPSFLFIAGFVLGWERRTSPGKPVNYARRASRLLGIAALGYALHFPFVELVQHRWADALRVGTQFDVLQCLAASLGLLLGLAWLATKLPRVCRDAVWWGGVVALAIVAVVGAPMVTAWTGGPVWLRAAVNQSTHSLFPLFPWAGFVLLGALAGAWPERPAHERAAGMIGLAVLAWVCRGISYSAQSPAFLLERAAWVLALAAFWEWSVRRRTPTVLLFAGQHSLKLYVGHLILITAAVAVGMPSAAFGLSSVLALLAAVGTASFGVAYVSVRFPSWRLLLPDARAASAPVLTSQPEA
jgi:uncharacterized membrane protein